jgi:hypothetical protein
MQKQDTHIPQWLADLIPAGGTLKFEVPAEPPKAYWTGECVVFEGPLDACLSRIAGCMHEDELTAMNMLAEVETALADERTPPVARERLSELVGGQTFGQCEADEVGRILQAVRQQQQ